MNPAKIALAASLLLLTAACDSGRSAEAPGGGIRIGAKLYTAQGELWGTVVGIEGIHRFPNGDVEPGVLVDYGPRMGDPPVPPQWLPRRSAERFTVR